MWQVVVAPANDITSGSSVVFESRSHNIALQEAIDLVTEEIEYEYEHNSDIMTESDVNFLVWLHSKNLTDTSETTYNGNIIQIAHRDATT